MTILDAMVIPTAQQKALTKEGLSTRVGRSAREKALYENAALIATEKRAESVQKMFVELKQKL